MKNSKNLKTIKGFTLIELLVTIAILGILGSMTVVGYTNLIKKASVSNDKALANQINILLSGYRVEESLLEDADIAKILQSEFKTSTVEIKTHEYQMDIYYNHNNGDFELQNKNSSIYNLHYYLNYKFSDETPDINDNEENISPEDNEQETITKTFIIDTEYSKNDHKTFSKICNNTLLCQEILELEYELSIGIYYNIEEGKCDTPVSIKISDLIKPLVPNLDLTCKLNQISIVDYENCELKSPTENENLITFYNPGSYELTINYGGYEETVAVNICNTYIKQNPELSNIAKLKPPHHFINQNILVIPMLHYFSISDYDYETSNLSSSIEAFEWDQYFNGDYGVLTNSGRLMVKINDEKAQIESIENMKRCVFFEGWSAEIDTFTITYYYQGMNGAWAKLTQNIKTTVIGDTVEAKLIK